MNSREDFTTLEIVSVAVGWSSTDFRFQVSDVPISTVFDEPSSGETPVCKVWFKQGEPGGDLSIIGYFREGFGQVPTNIVTGAVTTMSIPNDEPIMSALESSGGSLILRATGLQNAVFRRISELMELALEDEIEMSPSSFWDLWLFISARPTASVPNVFALDNGNFRAIWKNSKSERVALEFQGSQTVEFVIFKYDHLLSKMMRMTGIQGLNRIQALITAAYADHLLTK
jgi:hypothetical protein